MSIPRSHALDTVRGGLLLMIAVNHFGGPLPTLTYQPFGYVTGAEGFVLIAGISLGLLFAKFETSGRTGFATWCIRRAGLIYCAHVLVLVGILALASVGGRHTNFAAGFMPELAADPWRQLPAGLVLFYQPKYHAILPLYCLLVLVAPVVLGAMNRWGVARVLATSAGLWLVVRLAWPVEMVAQWGKAHGWRWGIKNPWAWQLLFVIGLAAGSRLERWLVWLRRVPLPVVVAGGLMAVGLKVTLSLHAFGSADSIISAALDGDRLGELRLFNTLLLAALVGWIGGRLPPCSDNPLAFLGRYSLPVFAFQIVALYAWRPYFDAERDPAWWLAVGSVALALAQFFPAWLAVRWQGHRRARG